MTERELFLQALEIKDPAERAAFVEEACAGQPDLRRHVNQLLKAHEFAGQFLDQPHPVAAAGEHTGAYASDSGAAETAGIVIAGRYKLLQCIGEGGMGSVWMADQLEPVKRRVAVKLIQAERDTSRTILSRFEAERQAIALMDHPNIAKLLDAGTTGERSFNRDSTGSVADPAVVWHFRGLAYGEQEQWAKAASDFAKCMHLQSPFASLSGGWRSLALAAAGDMPGYRKACAELLEEFSTAQDPGKANDAAWFCVRFPGAVKDPAGPLQLAEMAVAKNPKSHPMLNTLGAALYRAGRYEDCVTKLSETIEVHGKGGTAADWLFLAMAHHRLGHADEAKKWLTKAQQWIDQVAQKKPNEEPVFGAITSTWPHQLELKLIRAEAEALIKDEKKK